MFSCCICKSKSKEPTATDSNDDDTPYRPHPKTRSDHDSPLQPEHMHENQTLVTQSPYSKDEDCHPLTHTQVKTSKSGNTVTVVKTTTSYSKVVKTESEEEDNYEPGHYDRVYKTTVVRTPQNTRKRFNLKSVLDRRVRKVVKFDEHEVQYHQQCLFAHNRYRLKHGMKPLVLNKELCKYATEWAKHLAKKNILQHRKKSKYGENLALGTGETYKPEDAVKSWYDEIENYDFEKSGFTSNTGHFSQVVWQETTQLGVGVAQKDNRTWMVCNYDPPGNILNQYKENVVAPKGGKVTKTKKHYPDLTDNARIEGGHEDVKPSTSQAVKKVETQKNHKYTKFELECLDAHNKFRSLHACEPMTLNKDLCNLASDWAKHLAKIRSMYHRQQNEYGENIYQSINCDPTAEDAVKSWYDEINNYKFSKPGFSSGTGHFTQIVWSDSTELGVGRAKVDNITFVVCNYNPAGNVLNHYKTQVPPIGGFKDKCKTGRKSSNATTDCLDSSCKAQDMNGGHVSLAPKKGSNFFSATWHKMTKGK